MKFTIVIPTYNGADYVEEALLSAINQTRKADAIIVSDDNSTDNTLEICSRYNELISIYKNENGPSGFVNGWNNAISLVDDGYITILHQDDLLAPKFLEEAEKALQANPDVKHLFVPCNYIDGEGNIKREPDYCNGKTVRYSYEEYIKAYINVGTPHIHRCPGVITHCSIFDKCQYRTEAGHIADDDFFYRVGQYTDVIGILKPLASYREHEKSETGHLHEFTLVSRLVNDYLFQIKENTKSNFLRYYFIRNARTFVFRQFIYAIRNRNTVQIDLALFNKEQLTGLGIRMSLQQRFIFFIYRILGKNIMYQLIHLIR